MSLAVRLTEVLVEELEDDMASDRSALMVEPTAEAVVEVMPTE